MYIERDTLIRQTYHLEVTFESLKSNLSSGSPFSDPSLGDGDI